MVNVLKIRGIFEDAISGPLAGITKQLRGLDDVVKGSGSLKSVLMGVGLSAGAKAFDLLGGAVGGMTDLLGESIGKAQEFQDVLGKSQVVFGAASNAVERWADGAAEAFGQSKLAALDAAGSFGALLQPLGIVGGQAADTAMKLTQLGSDLASFYGGEVADAIAAIRSGLTGESEPLKKYGILVNETAVKQYAWANGIAKSGQELTEQQKVLARIGVIMRDSAQAQGDFARTSEFVNNKQRQLQAQIESLEVALGEKLLPLQLEFTKAQLEAVKATNDLIEGLDQLGRAGLPVGDFLQGFIDTINPAGRLAGEYRRELDALGPVLDSIKERNQRWADEMKARGEGARVVLEGIGRAAGTVADNAGAAGSAVQTAAKRIERSVPSVEDARRSWEDLASSLGEAIFGPDILRGREAGLQRRLREIKDEMKRERDPLRIKELKGDLADANEQLLETRLKLALLGDQTEKDRLQPYFVGLADKIKSASSEAQTLYSRILALYGLTGPLSGAAQQVNPFQARARQHGGPVTAGEAYLVGERGPELFVPNISGRIVAGASAAPMAPVRLEINLDGRKVAEVVDEHLGWRYAAAARTTRAV